MCDAYRIFYLGIQCHGRGLISRHDKPKGQAAVRFLYPADHELTGSGANFGVVATSLCSNCFSCGEHSSPDGGCGFGLNLKFAQVELVFANAVEKFDAGDGNFCSSEPFEAEHGTYPGFYSTMVLFNDIVEIF
jgi:hypothetical protein